MGTGLSFWRWWSESRRLVIGPRAVHALKIGKIIEIRPREVICQNPQHPYAKDLPPCRSPIRREGDESTS